MNKITIQPFYAVFINFKDCQDEFFMMPSERILTGDDSSLEELQDYINNLAKRNTEDIRVFYGRVSDSGIEQITTIVNGKQFI